MATTQTKRRWLGLLIATAVLACAASAGATSPIQLDPVHVRITDAPTFLGPTPKCPAFRSHVALRSPSGQLRGTSLLCVQSVAEGALSTEKGSLKLFLPGGTIELDVTLVDDFGNFPEVTQTATGSVTHGTGNYLGATGSLTGGGTIVIDPDGNPHPDLALTVDLD